MRNDKDTPPCRQHVANDVRDGMGFSGSWRSLNHEPIGLLQPANDLNLLVVERLGKEQVAVIRVNRPLVRTQWNLASRAQAVSQRLERVVNTVGGTQDQRSGRTFNFNRLAVL